jgi:hypothetical protein
LLHLHLRLGRLLLLALNLFVSPRFLIVSGLLLLLLLRLLLLFLFL